MRGLADSVRDFVMRPQVAVFAVVLTACGGESMSTSDATAVWSVDSVPTLSIGADEGDNLEAGFERLTGATRLPNGSVQAADLGAAPLRIFGADGTLERTVARAGKGPSEITYLAHFFRCGETLYTYDIDGHRVSRWTLEGRYEQEFRFQVPANQQVPYVSACNAAGRFVHLGWGSRMEAVAGYSRDTVPAWRGDSAHAAPMIFDSVPASERWNRTYEGRIVGSRPLPFAKQPSVGISADRIYIATGDPEGVRVYGLDGTRLPNIAASTVAPPVTPQDIRTLIEREVLADGESSRASIEREFGEITYPETKSAVSQLIVDAEGLLWLRPSVGAAAARVEWRVLDGDGQARATISLPAALDVFEIGTDYVLGREIDLAAGVPLLKSYRLRRALP